MIIGSTLAPRPPRRHRRDPWRVVIWTIVLAGAVIGGIGLARSDAPGELVELLGPAELDQHDDRFLPDLAGALPVTVIDSAIVEISPWQPCRCGLEKRL